MSYGFGLQTLFFFAGVVLSFSQLIYVTSPCSSIQLLIHLAQLVLGQKWDCILSMIRSSGPSVVKLLKIELSQKWLKLG